MPDATDDSKPRPVPPPPLDATPTVYSSLDAPPPPFQLKPAAGSRPQGVTRTPAARRLASDPAYRKRPKPRVKPAAVRMAVAVEEPPVAVVEVPNAIRPERLADDVTNPGVVLAVTVSLLVSLFVFLFATP